MLHTLYSGNRLYFQGVLRAALTIASIAKDNIFDTVRSSLLDNVMVRRRYPGCTMLPFPQYCDWCQHESKINRMPGLSLAVFLFSCLFTLFLGRRCYQPLSVSPPRVLLRITAGLTLPGSCRWST